MHKVEIGGKLRKPSSVLTVEDAEAQGMPNLAAEMRKDEIRAAYDYLVGRHCYRMYEYTNGRFSRLILVW